MSPAPLPEGEGRFEEVWTGDYIFENEWQSFRTKKDRTLELTSVFHECEPGRRKIAVKVVDIFGNDTMTIVRGLKHAATGMASLRDGRKMWTISGPWVKTRG
jgi:hypothetical protein